MKRRRIGEVAKELLERQGETSVTFGDLSTLHDISEAAGLKQNCGHPLRVLSNVMDALARDCAKPGAALSMHWGVWGLRGQLCRGFWIKGTEPERWGIPKE